MLTRSHKLDLKGSNSRSRVMFHSESVKLRNESKRNTYQTQIFRDEYQVDAASAHLIYHQEQIYYVSVNKQQGGFQSDTA